MNGINNLKISNAAIRKGCKRKFSYNTIYKWKENKGKGFVNKMFHFTYTENSDEPIHGGDLKACNTCKITSSKECNVEKDHLKKQKLHQKRTIENDQIHSGPTSSPGFDFLSKMLLFSILVPSNWAWSEPL